MNYELAKQLKDAGFPGSDKWKLGDLANVMIPRDELDFTLPTLSELIEACVDLHGGEIGLFGPDIEENAWQAQASSTLLKPFKVEWAATPEIAVAKLWLELNKTGGE